MRWPPSRSSMLTATLAVLAAFTTPGPAQAQRPFDLPDDFLIRRFDEWRLQHRETRLQEDINRGDTDRVNRDLKRVARGQWQLEIDNWRIQHDSFQPSGSWANFPSRPGVASPLVPHPLYPGYGDYASNPAQLYPLPRSNPGIPVGPAPAPASGASATPGQVHVVIVNAGPPGTAIEYVVDGVSYSIKSGQQRALDVGLASTIRYNRGGNLGEQRYALSAGVYEFQGGVAGWSLFKRRPS